MEKRIFIFATDTDYTKEKLTGAHKRFLELLFGIAANNNVILISVDPSRHLDIQNPNIVWYPLIYTRHRFCSACSDGMSAIGKTVVRNNIATMDYDHAISFGVNTTISLNQSGIKNIISLFREDLIGYLEAVHASVVKRYIYRKKEIKAAIISDKIILQCKKDKQNLIKRTIGHCVDIESKTYIQTNNVNASWMLKSAGKHKASYDIERVPRILFIGGFSNIRKGHGILLPAMARLYDEGYRFVLNIAGDGKGLRYYKEKYTAYKCFHFPGRVDVNAYLTEADFTVVPSLIDSCPNVVLESLNAGVAVYGTTTGGIPDILVNGDWMFDPNEKSIYDFIKKVLESACFVKDGTEQKVRTNELTFDWSECILRIIVGD